MKTKGIMRAFQYQTDITGPYIRVPIVSNCDYTLTLIVDGKKIEGVRCLEVEYERPDGSIEIERVA